MHMRRAPVCRVACILFLLKAACDCALSAERRLRCFRPTRERRDFRAFSSLGKRRDFCPLVFLLKAACDCVLSAERRLRRFRLTRERRYFRAFSSLGKRREFCPLTLICFASLVSQSTVAAQRPNVANISVRTAGFPLTDGFIPFYWDAAHGRVLMRISLFDEDVLYYVSAATGAGSVEMPLDRGILSSSVIRFQRSGPKVLVVEQNLKFRAASGTEAQAANVRDSFASSVLASLPVEAEEGAQVLVDATSLFMRDAADISGRLTGLNQGRFKFDVERSGFWPPRMKAFPDNTEIETAVTFAVEGAGVVVRSVVPDSRFMTMRIHHSFLRAPVGYRPRAADPRIGISSVKFQDYAKPVNERLDTAWVTRWRLEKQDPTAAVSEPKKPIVFYLDPAIPEPIRSAMREGALWWNKAFEAAGFRNAVQVKDPTPDMDPMDIRYAWVLWIDRDGRGFSSGGTFYDPRTGEILGSKTRMDSHRVRTIASYWEAYVPGQSGSEDIPAAQRDIVLQRQSLLTAHELGHVLGFGHNFASSLNERASVMEYPTPRVKVSAGRLDLSEAFQPAIGAYDAFMARYAYTQLDESQERKELNAILAEMRAKKIFYVPDTDPRWTWYDDRAAPVEYLRETMTARKIILEQYGHAVLKLGEPIGELRDMRLWMAYLHHRWAIESCLQYVGGMYHEVVMKGEGALPPTQIVPPATQRDVLGELMRAIEPGELYLPESLLEQLAPDPGTNREDMMDDFAFDQLRAARILAALVLEPLLEPQRAARIVAFADRNADMPSLPEVIDRVMSHTWNAARDASARHRSLRRVTQRVALDALMMLGAAPKTTPEVRSYVLDRLTLLEKDLGKRRDGDAMTQAHYRQSARDIAHYLENPVANAPASVSVPWGERPRSRFPLPPGPPL